MEEKSLEQVKYECFQSIKKTLLSRDDYIASEDYDKAKLLLNKAETNISFARELGLLREDEYEYLLDMIMN